MWDNTWHALRPARVNSHLDDNDRRATTTSAGLRTPRGDGLQPSAHERGGRTKQAAASFIAEWRCSASIVFLSKSELNKEIYEFMAVRPAGLTKNCSPCVCRGGSAIGDLVSGESARLQEQGQQFPRRTSSVLLRSDG
ncbi:hypothetical protein PVAP13_8NG224400 [Panicum virgatum]|uniref:Uncharacterized protein n=1 Tax=Panicum virgatum TaxID=38727 RepID=A0A8T0P7W2_PANVG|nr:hypothetical protein PVAP13_8NG224400 [Panicum virgatum]